MVFAAESLKDEGERVRFPGVRQCRVCKSAHRVEIEHAIAQGKSDLQVVQSLPDTARISVRNVGEHRRRKHPPFDPRAVSGVADAATAGLRDAAAKWTTDQAEVIAFAREVVRRVSERMAKGEITPTITQAIRMARLLVQHDSECVAMDRDEATAAVQAIVDHAKRLMDPESYQMLVGRFCRDPRTLGLKHLNSLRV